MPQSFDPAPEEAAELWQRWHAHADMDARRELVDRYTPFVRMLAAKLYAGRHIAETEFDEFLQFGLVGLLEAIDRYQPAREVPFTAFAGARINGAILNGLAKLSDRQEQISLRARLRRERVDAIKPVAARGEDALGALAEVAVGLAVGFMLEGSGLYAEIEPVSQGTDPYAHREVAELQRVLLALVEALPDQERTVIRYHYFQRMTVEQIGALIGVTKGRVSQVHRQALRRLREAYALATRIDLQL
jgi:RNA polymerase sigma factor for flagellar operon FliA